MTATYVVTYYSFKGGVGRTTLMVNVAHALAARRERVLIWDLDLEAPGVHHFPGLEPPERAWQSGFLEWLGATPPCPTPEPTPDWPSASWLDALCERVYSPIRRDAGVLRVLPAHGTHADLGRAHGEVDWPTLFVNRPAQGLHLFERVRDALIARFEPSFLFIDSRTGITDLGGMLAGLLPDCTVLVGNYGAQSTSGLRGVYVALDRFATEKVQAEFHRERKLERLLVASPVPSSPLERDRGRARWLDGFPGVAPRSLIEVPLVESLLYAEDVLVRSAPSSDAAVAYQRVATALLELRQARERSEPRAEGAVTMNAPLVERVKVLFALLGFEIAAAVDHECDVVAIERSALREVTHLVDCVMGPLGATSRGLLRLLAPRPHPRPGHRLVVTDAANLDARAAAQAAGVELRTVGELEDKLIDLRAYAAWLRRGFEDSELARGYVPQRLIGAAGLGDGDDGDAIANALVWAAGRGPRLWLVLGDDGSGKTAFVRRLAYELVTRADDDPRLPIPIAIDLRQIGAAPTLATALQQHLRAAIGWYGNPEAILYLLHAGRAILLLDGIDELGATTHGTGADDQLRVLARPTMARGLTPAANRVLVTCRRQGLREADHAGALVSELAPFDHVQMERFLEYRIGRERAQRTLVNISQSQSKATLAPRPIMLQMMADDLGGTSGEDVTVGTLYDQYVARWLALADPSSTLSNEQRARLVERLAGELWRMTDGELPHQRLAELVRTSDPLLAGVDAARVDLELRTAAFLVRSSDGAYRFSHRTFLEYWLARHLVTEAVAGADRLRAALTTERLTASGAALFADLAAARADRQRIAIALRTVVAGPYSDLASENALGLSAAAQRGER